MKNLYKSVSLVFAITIIISSAVLSVFSVSALGELPDKNNCMRHEICESLSDEAKAYYTGEYDFDNLSRLKGASDNSTSLKAMKNNELFDKLSTLMTDTHKYYTSYPGYKSGSLAYYWTNTDAMAGSSSYLMFYSDILKDDSITLNREHIWPKSKASFYQTNGGSDLHHLRPVVDYVNRMKSDRTFGYIKGTYKRNYERVDFNCLTVAYVHNRLDLFECKDDIKGDVARILLYVYCRWKQPNLYSSEKNNLPAPDSDSYSNNGKKVIESLDTLLNWCELDPVDSWEMKRNDLTEKIQGNRNVFIDYPELSWKLFDKQLPTGMSTPSHKGCKHQYQEISRVLPDKNTDGSFTEKCEKCGNEFTRALVYDTADPEPLFGDVNDDGIVDINDVTLIQQKIAKIPVKSFNKNAYDINQNKKPDIQDATFIQKWIAKLYVNEKIGNPIINNL